jgi:hypothetical protein
MLCPHGKKRRDRCRICGSKWYCEHGRQKSQCKECDSKLFCIHGRKKNTCIPCKGSLVCVHEKVKSCCKLCNGSRICIHGYFKQSCKICGDYCSHKRIRWTCRECGPGTAFCQHGRIKNLCNEPPCKGRIYCVHERIKYSCRECSGSLFCIHQKNKHRCKQCNGRYVCQSESCTNQTQKPNTLCGTCSPHPNPVSPSKELRFSVVLEKSDIRKWDTWGIQNTQADPMQCGKYRVDWSWKEMFGVVILELDEFAHCSYEVKCELSRQVQLAHGYGGLPVHIIRYNPDQLPNNPKFSKRERETLVLHCLRAALLRASSTFDGNNLLTIEYLFYYDIPESIKNQQIQTLQFKDENQYIAWFNIALYAITENEDRKRYKTLVNTLIEAAATRRAKIKQEKERQQMMNELD